MTYNVFGGTLNPAQPNPPLQRFPPCRRIRHLDLISAHKNEVVIGPRDNGFPGPAVALDRPGNN